MSLGTTRANDVLDWLLGGATPTRPSARYLALHTGDPGTTGASEQTGTGYARQALTMAAAASRASTNTSTHTFTNSGGTAWTQTTHWGIWDALTTGGFIWGGALTAARTLGAGESGAWAAGDLDLSFS